ncbi:MAG: signal recognition particle protein, partial [Proteobacteria bacterium]|nr:signal recognition particle protein [Pseudomonadota bacterium]
VADAMTGQDAVTVAEAFNNKLGITGVVLTKMDGDARGGAALSIKSVTGRPVKFVGMGEKLSELELFHPDRIASRILGMGDMMTLIEKAQSEINEDEAKAMAEKMAKAEFDFEDFLGHMRKIKKLGSMEGLLKMIPGMGNIMKQLGKDTLPEDEMRRTEAIISSMTRQERHQPALINQSRKERIAKGSGVKVMDVNVLIKNFKQMSKVMQAMMGGGKKKGKFGLPKLPDMSALGGMPGMDALGMGGMPGMGGEDESAKRTVSKKTLKERKKKKLNKQNRKKKKK